MSIVINGSGTVTGLAVGGLPDGTVDAGTLAANSVDSAELIDGAVDNSHMAAMAASKLTGSLPAISGASLTGLTAAQMPTGSVLQVVSTTVTASAAYTGNQYQNHVIGISVAITPRSTSSKILVTGHVSVGHSVATAGMAIGVMRGSTEIALGDASGSRQRHHVQTDTRAYAMRTLPFNVLDSPSTANAVTYSLRAQSGSANTLYINRDGENSTSSNHMSGVSTITAIEVQG
jgi:hypothetical protein